jgi:hypothetical protein
MIEGGAYRLESAGDDLWRDALGQEFRRDAKPRPSPARGKRPPPAAR